MRPARALRAWGDRGPKKQRRRRDRAPNSNQNLRARHNQPELRAEPFVHSL